MKQPDQLGTTYPLDYLYPEEFGELDDEEISLICEYNALDLVLIENASELFRQIFMSEGVFEKILEQIVLEARREDDIIFLHSQRFPFYVKGDLRNLYKNTSFNDRESKQQYETWTEIYRNSVHNLLLENRNYHIITILAVDLGAEGGHYAAMMYGHNTTYIFDSMQTETENKGTVGHYTPWFKQLASDIFPGDVVVPDCVSEQLSLQLTGGFSANRPLDVEKAEKIGKITEEKAEIISMQSTESQNHFCYLWAIWWIHLRAVSYTHLRAHETGNDLV